MLIFPSILCIINYCLLGLSISSNSPSFPVSSPSPFSRDSSWLDLVVLLGLMIPLCLRRRRRITIVTKTLWTTSSIEFATPSAALMILFPAILVVSWVHVIS
ncbi:hypothetical protein GGR58DRAFT_474704 [Xylaria digitata]|nr:hypothetical protein GGR58DRAFT_474704 [Xylaria digitata]